MKQINLKKIIFKGGIISIFFFKTLSAEERHSLSYIKPFEITLGKYYIKMVNTQSEIIPQITPFKDLNISFKNDKTQFQLQFNKSHYHLLNYFIYKENHFEIQLLTYSEVQNFPWQKTHKSLNVRSIFSYGMILDKKDIFLAFLGIINDQKFHSDTWNNNLPLVDYNQVFFVPGIQLRSHSVILKTFLEFPIYEIDFLLRTQNLSLPSRENIKANIQIQFHH